MGGKRLRLKSDEVELIDNYRRIKEEAEAEGIPVSSISSGWIKNQNASLHFKNPLFDGGGISRETIQEWIEDSVKELKPRKLNLPKPQKKQALRAVISDCHIGMNPYSEDAVFSFKYNEKIFQNHLAHLFSTLQKEIDYHGVFETIFIDDLGDGLDGYNGETTRAGHKLPQNMSNKESWRVYADNKLKTYIDIINLKGANKYVFRNAVNSNHDGDWGWSANQAIKMVLERLYPNIEFINIIKAVDHFEYGKHTFIITHGKDKATMTKNWPLHMNDKLKNYIRQYIDHYKITSPYIHVDKGDLHQVGYDREPKFDYRNFMSFAPPSAWVSTNFGVSYCGYSTQIIPKHSNEIQHTDIFFDLDTK